MPIEIKGCLTTEVAVIRRRRATTTARPSRKVGRGSLARGMPITSTSPITSGQGPMTEVFAARRVAIGLILSGVAITATAIENSSGGRCLIGRGRGSITRTPVKTGICHVVPN